MMAGKGDFSLEKICAGPLQTNSYLLTAGGESILIDSGSGHKEMIRKLSLGNRKVKALVMTHGHFDHIFDAMDYGRELNCQILIGKGDDPIMDWSYSVSERYMGKPIEAIRVDRYLCDGDTLGLGGSEIKVTSLPGHTPGSIGLIAGNLFFTGDVLFKGTIGRTDIGGSMEEMEKSLRKIMRMDRNLKVYPGHGEETTVESEIENNPFMAGIL